MRFVQAFPASKLKPWPGNPRKHEEDIASLVRSVEHFGWTNPILAQERTYRIIAGHGRLEAAKRAGMKTVPVIFLELNDADAAAYTVADNKLAELSEWDMPKLKDALAELSGSGFELALTGFDEEELAQMLAVEAEMAEREDAEEFALTITCRNEKHQKSLLRKLSAQGLDVRKS